MRVGIVGAGISGLAAARELRKSGTETVVFEKSKVCGGRCATRRIGDFAFDTGATSIAPRGKSLETVMFDELDASGLCLIDKPVFVHEALRVMSGDPVKNRIERYTYRGGNVRLAELLAEGIDVRLGFKIETLEKSADSRYRIADEAFDALILTPPAPQTVELLASIGEFRPLSNVGYRSCLSVLLGYAAPTPTDAYHAIIEVDQRHPLTWLSIESLKCPDRAPSGSTAMVAQMSPQFSAMHFHDDDERIVEATSNYVGRLYGKQWEVPSVGSVKKWRFSQPELTAMFDSVNHPAASILVAGDAVAGGRIEYAFESGRKAAQLLVGR